MKPKGLLVSAFRLPMTTGECLAFECVSRTHVGLRRKVNEDSLMARVDRGLLAVADGMGGHDAGEVASAKVTDALYSLPITYGLEALVDGAIGALQRVNQELITLAASDDDSRTIGSTVVGLAIADARFRCFWAGDSRAYRLRGGAIQQLTRDHSLVQSLVDAGMLEPGSMEDHPNANVVTRAVGAADRLEIDTVDGDALAGDRFLLASDGLTRLVRDDELLAQLSGTPAEEAADRLVDLVLSRGAPDNLSFIIATIG